MTPTLTAGATPGTADELVTTRSGYVESVKAIAATTATTPTAIAARARGSPRDKATLASTTDSGASTSGKTNRDSTPTTMAATERLRSDVTAAS